MLFQACFTLQQEIIPGPSSLPVKPQQPGALLSSLHLSLDFLEIGSTSIHTEGNKQRVLNSIKYKMSAELHVVDQEIPVPLS